MSINLTRFTQSSPDVDQELADEWVWHFICIAFNRLMDELSYPIGMVAEAIVTAFAPYIDEGDENGKN